MNPPNVDAQQIIEKIQSINDDATWGFMTTYSRTVNYDGTLNKHNFTIYSDDILGETFITHFSQLIDTLKPDTVELYTSDNYPHLSLQFKPNRIYNTPPESTESYTTLNPLQRPGTCNRCVRNTPREHQPITIKEVDTDKHPLKWKSDNTKHTLELCTTCSPAHYGDMSRIIDTIYINTTNILAIEHNNQITKQNEDQFEKIITKGLLTLLKQDIFPNKSHYL
jgi:hypothetical protein